MVHVGRANIGRRKRRKSHGKAEAGVLRRVDVREWILLAAIRVREAEGVEKDLADHERLVDRRVNPGDGAIVFEEQSICRANAQPAVAEGIPGKTDARTDVVRVCGKESIRHTWIAGEEHARGRALHNGRLRAGAERIYAIVDGAIGMEDLVANAEVRRQPR